MREHHRALYPHRNGLAPDTLAAWLSADQEAAQCSAQQARQTTAHCGCSSALGDRPVALGHRSGYRSRTWFATVQSNDSKINDLNVGTNNRFGNGACTSSQLGR